MFCFKSNSLFHHLIINQTPSLSSHKELKCPLETVKPQIVSIIWRYWEKVSRYVMSCHVSTNVSLLVKNPIFSPSSQVCTPLPSIYIYWRLSEYKHGLFLRRSTNLFQNRSSATVVKQIFTTQKINEYKS